MKRFLAMLLSIVMAASGFAFAADPPVPSCSAKGSTISAEYGNPIPIER